MCRRVNTHGIGTNSNFTINNASIALTVVNKPHAVSLILVRIDKVHNRYCMSNYMDKINKNVLVLVGREDYTQRLEKTHRSAEEIAFVEELISLTIGHIIKHGKQARV